MKSDLLQHFCGIPAQMILSVSLSGRAKLSMASCINIFYLELIRGARKQRERMWALTDYTTIFSFSHTLLQFFCCLFSFSSIYRSSFPSIFLLNRRTIIFFFASIKRQQNAASKKLLLHILMQKWLKTLLQGTWNRTPSKAHSMNNWWNCMTLTSAHTVLL